LTQPISRRRLLQAGISAGAAVALAGCGVAPASERPGASPTPIASATGSPMPTPSPTPVPPTASPTPGPSLEAKIARLLVVGFRGLTVDEAGPVADAIAAEGLGGVILFSRDQLTGGPRNVASPEQVRRLVADLRALAPDRALLVAIDQEGGRVARLTPEFGFPAVAGEAEIGEKSEGAVTTWATGIASTLADAGINLKLAPVVDLDVNPDNPAIGALGRAFSADPAVVTRDATIEIQAHRAAGVRTALKHFPGLGSASTNTDFGVADVTKTWTRRELDPYRDLIASGSVDAVMVGHVVNGQLDPDAPASLSEATITGLLRQELGWDGLVVTDDLQAAAITGSFGADAAIELALAAGNDLLLLANQQAYDADVASRVVELVAGLVRDGTITADRIDESYARVVAFTGG
jgi:beta-N-acetylhexosaminidase